MIKKLSKNSYEDYPFTLADLKVNEIINKRINQKYRNIKWDILSEENVKTSKNFLLRMIGYGFLILLMEQKISSKEQATMQCIWH